MANRMIYTASLIDKLRRDESTRGIAVVAYLDVHVGQCVGKSFSSWRRRGEIRAACRVLSCLSLAVTHSHSLSLSLGILSWYLLSLDYRLSHAGHLFPVIQGCICGCSYLCLPVHVDVESPGGKIAGYVVNWSLHGRKGFGAQWT